MAQIASILKGQQLMDIPNINQVRNWIKTTIASCSLLSYPPDIVPSLEHITPNKLYIEITNTKHLTREIFQQCLYKFKTDECNYIDFDQLRDVKIVC